MLQFLGDNGVKCTAIACNTISTMADRLRPCFDYKIVSIVEEAAKYVLREHLKSVGLIATEFTVASGKYAELIHEGDPECKVVGKGSPLARGARSTAATSTSTTLTPRSVRRSTTFSRAKRSKT